MADTNRAVEGALETARPYTDLARSLLEPARPPVAPRPSDGYESRRAPSDQLTDMRRFIVFRPGRSHEVAAMGERGEGREEAVRVIRDGRMIAVPSRGTEESSRAGSAHPTQASRDVAQLREALSSLTKEELSVFEKIFMAHFEGGIPIGEKLAAGQFKFLSKSEKAWLEFFQKFLPFTLEKKVSAGDVEMLVFRGLLKDSPQKQSGQAPDSKDPKAPMLFLVSDMKFLDGKTDKFARLQIQSQDLAQMMATHGPGDVLGPDVMAKLIEKFGGEEFSYLSLSHRVVNPDMVDQAKSPIAEAYRTPEQMKDAAIREGTRDVNLGIALSARTEQLVAEKLEINLKQGRIDADARSLERRGAEGRGAGGVELGSLFLGGKKKRRGAGETGDEQVFVPWFQQIVRPKRFKGNPRWWVPFMYFLAASGAGLAAVYAFRYWMAR